MSVFNIAGCILTIAISPFHALSKLIIISNINYTFDRLWITLITEPMTNFINEIEHEVSSYVIVMICLQNACACKIIFSGL